MASFHDARRHCRTRAHGCRRSGGSGVQRCGPATASSCPSISRVAMLHVLLRPSVAVRGDPEPGTGPVCSATRSSTARCREGRPSCFECLMPTMARSRCPTGPPTTGSSPSVRCSPDRLAGGRYAGAPGIDSLAVGDRSARWLSDCPHRRSRDDDRHRPCRRAAGTVPPAWLTARRTRVRREAGRSPMSYATSPAVADRPV